MHIAYINPSLLVTRRSFISDHFLSFAEFGLTIANSPFANLLNCGIIISSKCIITGSNGIVYKELITIGSSFYQIPLIYVHHSPFLKLYLASVWLFDFVSPYFNNSVMFPVSKMMSHSMMSAVCSKGMMVKSFGTSIPVILMKDMDDIKSTDEYYAGSSSAKKGDVITVKRGYARNFLIPRKMAMYNTRENVEKFSTEYAMKKAEKEAFPNVQVSAAASSSAGAAAWTSEKSEELEATSSATVVATDAPANTFTLARYSDGRGFLAFPVTANTVRRHMEQCMSSGGSSENSYGFQISTPNGTELATSHVKITWLELAEPIRQVGTHSINVTLSYFESASATEASSVTMPVSIIIKHTSVL